MDRILKFQMNLLFAKAETESTLKGDDTETMEEGSDSDDLQELVVLLSYYYFF